MQKYLLWNKNFITKLSLIFNFIYIIFISIKNISPSSYNKHKYVYSKKRWLIFFHSRLFKFESRHDVFYTQIICLNSLNNIQRIFSSMWADTILIVFISICTALLGEGNNILNIVVLSLRLYLFLCINLYKYNFPN